MYSANNLVFISHCLPMVFPFARREIGDLLYGRSSRGFRALLLCALNLEQEKIICRDSRSFHNPWQPFRR